MKKSRREFFEVFRRVPEQKEPTTWWRKNTAAAPAGEPAAAVPAGVKPPAARGTARAVEQGGADPQPRVAGGHRRRDGAGAGRRLCLGPLARPFGPGETRGERGQQRFGPPADAAKTPALAIAAPDTPPLPYYTLRLMMLEH